MNHFMIKKTLLKMKFSIISLLLLAGNMVFGQANLSTSTSINIRSFFRFGSTGVLP